MRILHIHDIANVGATLTAGLQQIGYQAELRRLNLAAPHGSTLTKLLLSPLRLREMLRVNRQVRRGRYDIVHIHFAYLGWLGIIGRYPYFLHCHGSDIRRDYLDWRRRWFIHQSILRAKAVFFATPDLADLLLPIRPDAIFLPNPVNTALFHPNSPPVESHPKILLGSAFYPVKGVEAAMQGLQEIVKQHPEIEITAFATGPLYPHYQNSPGFRFIPPVPHPQMAPLYQAHEIIIGQFKIGSLGMVELEGMACGRPVICHYEPTSWYPESPPIIQAQTPEEIRGKVVQMLTNPVERAAIGDKGAQWIGQYHDFRQVAYQLSRFYR